MLRLWPERRSLVLLPDGARLKAGEHWSRAATAQAGGNVFGAAAALLQATPPAAWPLARLDALLSDEMARSTPLAWQDGLRTSAQQARYAEACLEDAGVEGGGWTLRYDYRHHGRAGLAFAVRTDTLQQLAALAADRRLQLGSVLPVSAAAYWRQPFFSRRESLTMLHEAHRSSLLHFNGQGLVAIEVQPVQDTHERALRRLLRQAQLRTTALTAVYCWSADDVALIDSVVAECYPDVPLHTWQTGDLI